MKAVEPERLEHRRRRVADLRRRRALLAQREGDFSNTVMSGQVANVSKTMPSPLLGRQIDRARGGGEAPATHVRLAGVGLFRPARSRSVVVFPQPLGPSSVASEPAGTSDDT